MIDVRGIREKWVGEGGRERRHITTLLCTQHITIMEMTCSVFSAGHVIK